MKMFRRAQSGYKYTRMEAHDPDDRKNVSSSDAGASTPVEQMEEIGSPQDTSLSIEQKLSASRRTYWGSLGFNLLAFFLPALYSTLSKLWVANIDSSLVATTDVYTYMSTVAEVLNEGLPRTAWLIIGDTATRTLSSRISLSYTMLIFQTLMGLIMTVVFVGAAERFAASFVPEEVRSASLSYVRLSAPVALSSAIQVAVGSSTRALDQPDVPLIISSVGFTLNIVLDLLVISKFHVGSYTPTVLTQAGIRLACDMISAIAGVLYFVYLTRKLKRDLRLEGVVEEIAPQIKALKILARPTIYTFTESFTRNGFYLWVVSTIIGLGSTYATAWGVFNTIRWGLIMVPVNALQASSLTFVGHEWSVWHARVDARDSKPTASKADLRGIVKPAFISAGLALVVEIPICILLSLWGMRRFSYYLSNSMDVALVAEKMWQNIDWCYIFYAVSTQFSGILLATVPRWYLYQALGSNLLWMLPWAIVMTVKHFSEAQAWKFYAIIFGGALVFDFFNVGLVVGLWAWRLNKGSIKVRAVDATM